MTEEQKLPKKYNKHKPKLNYQLSRVLRHAKFSPLKELIDNVYPLLEPKDKMTAIFQILSYLHSKPRSLDLSRKKGPGIQTNVQINMEDVKKLARADITSPSHEDLVKLIAAAEGKDDK